MWQCLLQNIEKNLKKERERERERERGGEAWDRKRMKQGTNSLWRHALGA